MPNYDYKCYSCNIAVEIKHSIDCKTEWLCAGCGEPFKKIIPKGTAIHFKGKGLTNERVLKASRLDAKTK